MDVDAAQPRSTEPLFLFDDDSDVEFVGADRDQPLEQPTPPTAFEAIEEPNLAFQSAPFDLEAYQRESLARHQKELNKTRKSVVVSDSAPQPSPSLNTGNDVDTKEPSGGKKSRQKPMRLDEGLLLSSKGFPQLIKDTKDFKIKGKGHEATDLNRLLQIYQFWTHQLHPKTQFRDTVSRIEKLCHSRRMLSALSVWRDEVHGKPEADLQLSDDEHDLDNGIEQDDGVEAPQERCVATPSTDGVHTSLLSSRASSHPPTTDIESEPGHAAEDISDSDMDALIQEHSKEPQDDDFLEDPATLEDYFGSTAPPPGPAPVHKAIVMADKDVLMTDAAALAQVPVEDEDYWGEDMYI